MIDSVPLIQNANDAQQINASIIAMKKASRELDEKIVKLNSLNSELDKKIALLDSGLNKEIEDRKEAINSLDVSSVGGSGKYISAISETDGKINATATNLATSVASGNSSPVTSDAVYSALLGKLDQGLSFGSDNTTSRITLEKGMYIFLCNFHPFSDTYGFYIISVANTGSYNRVRAIDNNSTITLTIDSNNVLELTTTTYFRGLLVKLTDTAAV